LSVTIILSLNAVETARRAATLAAETRRAGELLRHLLETAPRRIGAASGQSSGFDWRIDTTVAAAGRLPAVQLCERSARLVALRGGRRYGLSTTELCPAPGPS
jgi:hypothetical protein